MSRRYKVSGTPLKSTSDSSLAKPHKEGAIVEYVQPAKDNKWGRYYYQQYHRYHVYFVNLESYYKNTFELLSLCRKEKLHNDNARHINSSLRDKLEFNSALYVVTINLAFEYMTIEMLYFLNNILNIKGSDLKVPWENIDLKERIKVLCKNLKLNDKLPEFLTELLNRRDIVEHPSNNRLYNVDQNEWENVHLSWVLSGKIEGSYNKIIDFVNPIIKAFDEYTESNKKPGILKGVVRGLKSLDPYKL